MVLGTPAFGEADPHRIRIYGAGCVRILRPERRRWMRLAQVGPKDAKTVTGWHAVHEERTAAGSIQRRRVDENWPLAAVIHPHAVFLQTQGDSCV